MPRKPNPGPRLEPKLPIAIKELPPEPAREEPVFDPFEDRPVINSRGKRTKVTLPVRKMSRLARDPGRGMMPPIGELDPVYCGFLDTLPLDQLKFALAQQETAKAEIFLASLCDLTKSKVPITTLAKQAGIGLTEMMQIWRSHCHVAALRIAFEGTIPITGDMVEDARSLNVCCSRCDGGGQMRVLNSKGYQWKSCLNCNGTGLVRRPGDSKSREYLYKATGFIKPAEGLQVHTHVTQNNVDSVLNELDRLPSIDSPNELPLSAVRDVLLEGDD